MARYGKQSQKTVEEAMEKMKQGKLKSGGSGKKVRNPKQAIAIGLSEARKKGQRCRLPRRGASEPPRAERKKRKARERKAKSATEHTGH